MIKNEILEVLKQTRKVGGPRTVFRCKCLTCNNEVFIRKAESKNHSGKCKTCSHTKRPFESLYNSFIKDWRKLTNTLTYEQFIDFTKIDKCHYCFDKINWVKYSTVSGRFSSRAYYLDRMNSKLGYHKENVVVCCTKCNLAKGNRYSYLEWFGMTEYFRKKS